VKKNPSQWIVSKYGKEEENYYLKLLKKHFGKDNVSTFEEHPDAMISIIWSRTFDEICGKNYQKKRIPQRKQKAIKEKILQKLRSKYGRWINLTNIKFKGVGNASYQTNFNRVYKIKNSGILYGSPNRGSCGNIFVTSHCIERLEERVDPRAYSPLTEDLKRIYKTDPTSADILVGLILNSNKEYAMKDGYCYLNIRMGVLALEDLGDIFIAKTFLTPDMLKEMEWCQPLIDPEIDIKIDSFADLLKLDTIKIREPKFFEQELAETFFKLLLSEEIDYE